MSKQFYQVYSDKDIPNDLSKYTNISHLGIQCRPGLQFTINGSILIMNNTGIFELEIDNDMPYLTSIDIVGGQSLGNTPLIIDIIGEIREEQ